MLSAHPGGSQGRPRTTPGSQPISQYGLPILLLPESPCPGQTDPTTRPGCNPHHPVSCPDNGSAYRSATWALATRALGIRHLRTKPYTPRTNGKAEAFIESWFGKLKEREVWLNEYETLDDARHGIGGYVDRYHHRPHSGLNYRTPLEVRQTWEDLPELQKHAA